MVKRTGSNEPETPPSRLGMFLYLLCSYWLNGLMLLWLNKVRYPHEPMGAELFGFLFLCSPLLWFFTLALCLVSLLKDLCIWVGGLFL